MNVAESRAGRVPGYKTVWTWWIVPVLVVAGFGLVSVDAMFPAHVLGWVLLTWLAARLLESMRRQLSGHRFLLSLVVIGLALRAGGARAKYQVTYTIYHRSADAFRYQDEARIVALQMRDHLVLPGDFHFHRPGTDFVTWVLAGFYRCFGAHLALGTMMFVLAAFSGVCCLLIVARDWLPAAGLQMFAIPLMLMPSLWFWPSSIGKEAWISAAIGLMTLGISRLVRGSADVRLVVGLVIATGMALMVRPHVVLLAACAWLPVCLLVRSPGFAIRSRAGIAVGAVVVAMLALVMIRWGFSDSVSGPAGAASGMLEMASSETAIGGSAFAASPITSVTSVPGGVWAVLGRPHLGEAHGWLQVLTAIELMATMAWCLVVIHPRRLLTRLCRNPLVAFAAVYVLGFVFAFSRIANFGILARQRVQLWPMLFLVVAGATRFGGDAPGPATRRRDEN